MFCQFTIVFILCLCLFSPKQTIRFTFLELILILSPQLFEHHAVRSSRTNALYALKYFVYHTQLMRLLYYLHKKISFTPVASINFGRVLLFSFFTNKKLQFQLLFLMGPVQSGCPNFNRLEAALFQSFSQVSCMLSGVQILFVKIVAGISQSVSQSK